MSFLFTIGVRINYWMDSYLFVDLLYAFNLLFLFWKAIFSFLFIYIVWKFDDWSGKEQLLFSYGRKEWSWNAIAVLCSPFSAFYRWWFLPDTTFNFWAFQLCVGTHVYFGTLFLVLSAFRQVWWIVKSLLLWPFSALKTCIPFILWWDGFLPLPFHFLFPSFCVCPLLIICLTLLSSSLQLPFLGRGAW